MVSRLARAFVRLTLVLLVIVFAGALAGITIAGHNEQVERTRYPPPGKLVDIGDGRFIHVRTWGTRIAGDPAIILDSSAGMPSSEWAWVGRALARRHFVLAYDRPGLAWSIGPSAPRDAMSSADSLAKALAAAEIPPPYVVVGHSFGGYSARAFAGTHLNDVVGLVLLDTTDPATGGISRWTGGYQFSAWHANLGFHAMYDAPDNFWQLPPEERPAANAVTRWPSFLNTVVEELSAADTSAAQINPLDLSQMPLLVVAVPNSPAHVARQKRIASISNSSTYLEQHGDHTGMLLDHDQAQVTAQRIEAFVDSLLRNGP